jgi:Aldo/keto reductase family
MLKLDASKSGAFRIGGEIEVHRLGFGAMRLTGPWSLPADRAETIRTLKRVPELRINFIDTADSYGPDVSEQLIRETLYPYDGILIATKAGLRRPRPGMVVRNICANRQSKVGNDLGLSRLESGSYIVSIRKCHATSSSLRSSHCKMKRSSAIRGLATFPWRRLKLHQKYSKWRRCRTATISSIAAVKTC